ncbi:uncharacterized protein METZ01_LOCUS331561, partial [marine metagenome]
IMHRMFFNGARDSGQGKKKNNNYDDEIFIVGHC